MKGWRHCKNCGTSFEKKRPLQAACSIQCSWEWARKLKEKKEKREWTSRKKELKITSHAKEYKKELQRELNKLSKKIDLKLGFKCIDCGKDYGKQIDASHFHNTNNYGNIRYNLHNVHASKSDCNQWGRGRKPEYYLGLIERYSKEYADFIRYELPNKYKVLSLDPKQVFEALTIVRKLNREFDTFDITNGIKARDLFNGIIGLYK